MQEIFLDVCKALGDVDIQDINMVLIQIGKKYDVGDQDVWIARLIREKKELEAWFAEREVDFKKEEAKTKRA